MTLFLFGLTSGATVLTTQYLGKSDKDAIEKIYGIAVKTAVFVTAFFIMAELLLPGLILKIFTSDPAVIIPQMYAELEAAGMNDIQEELQRQINEYLGK